MNSEEDRLERIESLLEDVLEELKYVGQRLVELELTAQPCIPQGRTGGSSYYMLHHRSVARPWQESSTFDDAIGEW